MDINGVLAFKLGFVMAMAKFLCHATQCFCSRKQTLKNLAQHFIDCADTVNDNIGNNIKTSNGTNSNNNPDDAEKWLALKGIGPWTVSYAKMRGLSDPDIFLGGDLGVKKAQKQFSNQLNSEQASPWRSYLTFQLWSQLHE